MKISVLVLGLAMICVVPARAQTTSTAANATTDRPNFSGTWSIDRGISNDATQAAFETPRDQDRRPAGRQGGGGGRGGFGGFGGARFGSGGQGNRSEAVPGTPEERTRLREFTDLVKRASESLVISHADPSLAITDAQGRTQLFQTTGAKDAHALATATVTSTTHWDGSRLVTEYDMGAIGKLVSTYTLLASTKQLVVRTRLEMPERQRTALPELKLVYGLAGPAKPAPSPAPPGAAASYAAPGGGHLIQSVSADGRYVTLEDRSLWEIQPRSRFQTAEWLAAAGATVRTALEEDGYLYEIVNTDEDEGVMAKYVAGR